VEYNPALRRETWERVFLRKTELVRADGDRFEGICEIWILYGLCDSKLLIVAASTNAPAAKGELPCLRAVPSASLRLCVLRGIWVHQR
jgi:hypothetical protein